MIIVTGGAGFIGSAIVWALNQRGISDILIVDLLNHRHKETNLKFLNYTEYQDRDLFRENLMAGNLPSDIEAVFHLGANSSTTEKSWDNLLKYNVNYTRELCEFAIEKQARFIYASSAATYGDGSQGFVDSEDEIEKLAPLNLYGKSKQEFDLWAKGEGLLNQIVGLKYFNVYGPNEYHKGEMRSVVCKSFEQVRDAGTIKLFRSHRPDYADGEQKRDFLYVKDAIAMTLFFMDHPQVNGLFNLGSGVANSWNTLAASIFAAMNKEPVIEYIDMPESIRDKYQYYTCADITKIRQAGYTADITTIQTAVRDYIQNYLLKGTGVENLKT